MDTKKTIETQINNIFANHSIDEVEIIIVQLMDIGLSPIEMIKIINQKLKIGLGEAKEVVSKVQWQDRLNKFYSSYPTKDKVFINQIVQEVRTINEGLNWFNQFEDQYKLEILRLICDMSIQAAANKTDVALAIDDAKLKPTCAPCALLEVLLKKGTFKIQLPKLLRLPTNEYGKTFMLFINLLKIADQRRRKDVCKNSCTHWWHQDLSNKMLL